MKGHDLGPKQGSGDDGRPPDWGALQSYSATARMAGVLPHPGMLPSGSSIASPECSRRHVSLSIDYAGSGAFRGVTQTGFPVRSASLLSRPDLAPPEPRRATEGMRGAEPPGATRSALFRASMARMASTGPSPK